jgi:hypothetical protein
LDSSLQLISSRDTKETDPGPQAMHHNKRRRVISER